MTAPAGRVIVVGGGIIGAACAHFLNRDGWQVTVIDSDRFGRGCSHGNCGFVCPSHVLPLAEPGAVASSLKLMLKRDAPLRIKPQADPRLWLWLVRFARRCNQRDMLEAARARHALLQSSAALYHQLLENEPLECQWQRRGLLYVFQSDEQMEQHAETDRLLRQHFDLGGRRYDGRQLVELEGALKPGLAGGWLYETDFHLRPDALLASWCRLLRQRGVTVLEGCRLQHLVTAGGRALALVTGGGEMTADVVIIATGAWTPLLRRQLGCSIPIQPGKGYSITMPRPERCPQHPLIFPEHRVAVTPLPDAYRLGSMMELVGYDDRIPPARLEVLKRGAAHYLHQPYREPIQEQWYGWRPMTYDGKPIIDRCPALNNVFIAAGHNMLGLSMAPATGRLIAELAGNRPPHIDPQPYAATRF